LCFHGVGNLQGTETRRSRSRVSLVPGAQGKDPLNRPDCDF
jgi:hypothetical protein